jgi:GNAT superfamily N-acetyltransferase
VTSEAAVPARIELLADHPDLIGAVGELRWQEWALVDPDRPELAAWVDVTARESGRAGLPVTFVAIDEAGAAAGAVGLGQFDPDERRDRSPWVLGMIVRSESRGRGVGRLLLDALRAWASERRYERLWVATGDPAVSFYQACGWTAAETFERPGGTVTVLTAIP